jgi:hypothetical protein
MNYYNRAMLTTEELTALTAALPADADRVRLLATLRERAAPLLARPPIIPRVKALLSRNGGICPDDGTPLRFDPWSGDRHGCPRCGQAFTGDRHDRHWARAQHLWLAERMAELSLLAALTDDEAATERALGLYAVYEELYFDLPNRDNVLGPSHLFFSTYLESLWITSYLAGAFILRESGRLSEERIEGVNRVADEAAALIGEFNEGLSNRQTWHAAALTAIAAWFGDEELARNAVESRTGLLGHLADGFGNDGFWWEGENYHLFALRGLMLGLHWARAVGYELLDDPALRTHFREAVLAPARSALPDFTYPARRDSRYGVSLAEPPSLELWEAGRAWLPPDDELDTWLGALYALPSNGTTKLLYDAWLHDAGRVDTGGPDRAGLSWWAFMTMGPPLPPGPPRWRPGSILLPDQGLAILRRGGRYTSLECGRRIGGHGHPDRLHLTLFDGGVHWLPDPGTGTYVEPELAWYRSALAHNAPRLDGINAGGGDAWCQAFEAGEEWSWCRARAGALTRTLVAGPGHLVDLVEIEAEEECWVDLPWHLNGTIVIESSGRWESAEWSEPFATGAERFVPGSPDAIAIRVERPGAAPLAVRLMAPGAELLRAMAPGLPGSREQQPFLLLRVFGQTARWVTVLDSAPANSEASVTALTLGDDWVEVNTRAGSVQYRLAPGRLVIESGEATRTLTGERPEPAKYRPLIETREAPHTMALALRLADPPAVDGSLDGFDTGAPLTLDEEHQYRRSEEPYDAERLRAEAWVNWDGEALYVAVAVTKPEVLFPGPGAAPQELDNEADDINSDGVQIHLRMDSGSAGVIAVPREDGALATRRLWGEQSDALAAEGRWSPTDEGYLVTLRLSHPRLAMMHPGERLGFDLLVNEMRPGRLRRAGQLAWNGSGGWIYLRGDRQDASELGVLELG